MKPERYAPLLFVLAALAAMAVGWWSRASLPISAATAKPLGLAIFLLGMAAFTWTVACLKHAFLGDVAPVTKAVVTTGPFRWIRHPLYLSMIITLLGIGLALCSLWGMIAVFVLFVPAVIYRARLEEKALSAMFGRSWDDFVGQTKFLIPFLW